MAKAKKRKAGGNTVVAFLLDRTQSMGACLDATIESFNGYLDGLGDDKSIKFSLVTFDTVSLDKVCSDVNPKDAPRLNRDNYKPRSATNLIDSAYTVIKALEEKVGSDKDTKVVCCIQTDGEENSSVKYNWEQLKHLIDEKTKLGWQFNFMGAGIDAYQQASRMGIAVGQTMSYDHTDLGATRAAFSGRATATSLYASGARADMSISMTEKIAAKDKFVSGAFKPKKASSADDFKL